MESRTLLLILGLNFSLLGNLEARDCPWGFIAKGRTLCVDIDECKEWDSNPPCGSNAACYNTQGSFYCQCIPGFISTTTFQFTALTGECKDLDECQGKLQVCTSNAICLNTIGSFNCQCKPGFRFSAYAGHCEGLMEIPISSFLMSLPMIVSRLLLLPLSDARGCQTAHHYSHCSPSLRAPALHRTHLDSITSLIIYPISVTPSS
ncbi:EGF-containing fibulin-like extracellular matrix protein 1 isoform X1 [Oncorhynchus kisutch]|uniref:EGF-containing fibulin-like extracellular matrix protein 1 isoform X1 n=1 Tax=Oncorhynchus kisutch TaxID=8019 RepID=UPI0012DC9C4E|nr:EGF-containing fibulin-like extracellular matrix protein 1 isoform X1 [Oncorhynchus kisutch]XP_031673779.1 EGF-containing fibulin-like extracellular matrix protein 1 isoform X1 [Oncorhynchus kisutch]